MKLKKIGLLVFTVAMAFLYFYEMSTGNYSQIKCLLYSNTGIYCPGCGSQRATHELLHFNFLGMFHQNLLYVLGLVILGYHLLITSINFIFKKNIYNFVFHPKTPLVLLLLIVLFWILRNIPVYPFNLLAPK